jgi:hypothetical protein
VGVGSGSSDGGDGASAARSKGKLLCSLQANTPCQSKQQRPHSLACGLVRWPSGKSVRASWHWLRWARK